jgi:hypothetical protein
MVAALLAAHGIVPDAVVVRPPDSQTTTLVSARFASQFFNFHGDLWGGLKYVVWHSDTGARAQGPTLNEAWHNFVQVYAERTHAQRERALSMLVLLNRIQKPAEVDPISAELMSVQRGLARTALRKLRVLAQDAIDYRMASARGAWDKNTPVPQWHAASGTFCCDVLAIVGDGLGSDQGPT